MFMTDQQSAKLSQPGVGAFDNPAPFVASQFSAIFISPLLVVLPVRRYQLDATPFPSLSQWIGVVTPVCDHPFRLLPRPAFCSGDADFDRLPVPSTSFPCRAWFYRRPSPLFRRSETAIQEGFVPFQQALRIQSAQ